MESRIRKDDDEEEEDGLGTRAQPDERAIDRPTDRPTEALVLVGASPAALCLPEGIRTNRGP